MMGYYLQWEKRQRKIEIARLMRILMMRREEEIVKLRLLLLTI